MTNAQQFNAKLKEWTKDKVPEEIWKFQRYIALEALRRIVLKTPVDTGRARGNWQVTTSAPAQGQVDKIDKSGSGVMTTGAFEIGKVPLFGIVFITNNVPYIIYLEKGSSKQAPAGMVDLTIQEMLQMFR